MAVISVIMIIFFIIGVITIIANWKVFTKAGKPGWTSLIPFYNMYQLFEVAGMNGWMFLLLLIPFVNFIIIIMLNINLAKVFGKDTGFAIGLILFNPIFMLILAFSDATYIGNNN
ncbi:MAG: hypothetical protein HFJ11_02545 [Bacilli bacterium]|nr:hypothetical protein [Bacilli bacterium]